MSFLDWSILVVVLLSIIIYGIYKSKTTKNIEGYFLSNRSMPWYLVLLSIMGTQASAILGNLQGLVSAREAQTSILADSEPLRQQLEANKLEGRVHIVTAHTTVE